MCGQWILDPTFTAVESGLDAFINWDKDFIGKESTLSEKKQGPKKKTCYHDSRYRGY